MRSQVILDGLKSLQPDEEVTAKQIVQWMIGALEITVHIPYFTITSTGEVSRAFFKHLQSESAKVKFPFHNKLFVKNFFRVVHAVGRIFDVTIEEETSLKCWIQIGQFVNDLQKHCKNGLFTLVGGAMSVSLLKKMIAVPGFNTNKDIVDSMLLYYKCGPAVADAKIKVFEKKIKISKHLNCQYKDCIDAFFELIGENLIFSSDTFFPTTAKILLDGVSYSTAETVNKYLDAVNVSLGSNDEVAKCNMAMFLQRKQLMKLLYMIMKMKPVHSKMVKMLKMMLEYSREKNIPYEIDWTTVFVHVISSTHDFLELLFLETQGAEQDEEIKSCNLVERVIQIFLRYNDEINKLPAQQHRLEQHSVDKFMNLIKDHINFVTCDTLFSLLRKHVADSPATCAVIILFIYRAVTTSTDLEARKSLLNTAYRQITYMKSYPELLCRLNKMFDFSNVMNNEHEEFRKQMLLIVPEAFRQCSLYCTAVDLLTVLKAVGYENNKLIDLFYKQLHLNRSKETLVLILAADDVFNISEKVNPFHRRRVFDYFKQSFKHSSSDKQVLYASLMIHMLAALQSTPDRFLGEASNTVENEARDVFEFLSKGIHAADKISFAAVHLGIAICVYHSTFQRPGVELLKSFSTLAAISFEFRLSYESDAKKDPVLNDLHLVSKFWRCACGVYKKINPSPLTPSIIFESYPHMKIYTVATAEEFLLTILDYGCAAERFELFVQSIHSLVRNLEKGQVNPIVNKLFKFVEKTKWARDKGKIATMIFLSNLPFNRTDFLRPEVVWEVQINLYKNQLNIDYRKRVMYALSAHVAREVDPTRKYWEELCQYLLHTPIADMAPETEEVRHFYDVTVV
ncbi:uncharacterized protein LOC119081368 [Bradysia coprophila]|uniref:uncharacterized protein LOC119081368 n=1 Tax=Bradysia coprophila TaxID=38358 RepID=UPI00187DC353|nr:uncharacterized protein LOC119081368 [Bradysia coprophila]